MVAPVQTAATTSIGIRSILYYGAIIFIIIFILFSSIKESIDTKSPMPVIKEFGNQFFLANQKLATTSQAIIDTNGAFIKSGNIFGDILNVFTKFSQFFTSIFIIYLWFKFLMWMFAHSPVSNKDNWFANFLLAIFSYYILEVLFIVVTEAIAGKVGSFSDFGNILMIPIDSFILFFKASYLLMNNLFSGSKNIVNNLNDTFR